MKFFNQILHALKQFQLDEPFTSETELEQRLKKHLIVHNIKSKTQQTSRNKRYDVISYNGKSKICIELKIVATTSNVKQFDRYHKDFPQGFIILCWKATVQLREIFDNVNEQSPTPIALVELSQRHSMI